MGIKPIIIEESISSGHSAGTSTSKSDYSRPKKLDRATVLKPTAVKKDTTNVETNVKSLERASTVHQQTKPKRKSSLLRRLSKRHTKGRLRRMLANVSARLLPRKSGERKLRAIDNAPSQGQLLSQPANKTDNNKKKPRAVIVGGGPAGSTAAMFLARNGYEVDVYEGRAEPNSIGMDNQRAYMIALTDRGLGALEDLEIEIPKQSNSGQHQSGQIAVHSRLGTLSASCEERSVCFTRAGLAQMLIDQARTKYPDQIRFHFDYACQGVNVADKSVTFRQRSPTTTSSQSPLINVSYDLLIGADGVNSAVRSSLQEALPELHVDISDSGREYKSFHSLPSAGLKGSEGKECSTLHLWPGSDPASMVSAHTAGDGTFSGTLSLRTGEFETMETAADVRRLLQERFPKLPEAWLDPMAEQATASGRANSVGRRVVCSQMHGPGVILLGDAAHAVTPIFGQGANSALESCMVLGRALEKADGDVDALPEMFNEMRSPDVKALGELDSKAHALFWRGSIFDAAFMQVATHLLFGGLLTMISGGKKPNLVQIGGRVPYRRLQRELVKDTEWASALGGAVSLVTLVVALGNTISLG